MFFRFFNKHILIRNKRGVKTVSMWITDVKISGSFQGNALFYTIADQIDFRDYSSDICEYSVY